MLAAARAQVEDPVGVADEVEVVLDDDEGGAAVEERLEDVEQGADVEGVEADRGLVEDEEGIGLGAAHFLGELQALGFAAGEVGGGFPKGEVAQAEVAEGLEALAEGLGVAEGLEGGLDVHGHELGEGVAVEADGVGGVGLVLFSYIKSFNYHVAFFIILLIGALVIAVDAITGWLRRELSR